MAKTIKNNTVYTDEYMRSSDLGKWFRIKFDYDGLANFWINSSNLNNDIDLYIYDDEDTNSNLLDKSTKVPGRGDDIVSELPVEAGVYYYIYVKNYDRGSCYFDIKARIYLDIEKYVEEYTDFVCDGVSVELPYYMTPAGTTLYGGKNTPKQIKEYLRKHSSPSEYQDFVNDEKNKAKTGIDCSGFVTYVLNEGTNGKILKHWDTTYANGILATHLANSKNGERIRKAKDVIQGCTIRTDDGGHVLVVYEVVKNSSGKVTRIRYAHSNSTKGPHKAYIRIGDENQDLDGSAQRWYDSAYTDATAKRLYNYTVFLDCIDG